MKIPFLKKTKEKSKEEIAQININRKKCDYLQTMSMIYKEKGKDLQHVLTEEILLIIRRADPSSDNAGIAIAEAQSLLNLLAKLQKSEADREKLLPKAIL